MKKTSIPTLKQIKLSQGFDVEDHDSSVLSSSSSSSKQNSEEETRTIFVIESTKPKTVKIRTESGKSLRIKVSDVQFEAQISKLFEDEAQMPDFDGIHDIQSDKGLVFESKQTRKERRQAEKHWNKTLSKLKIIKDTDHKHSHKKSSSPPPSSPPSSPPSCNHCSKSTTSHCPASISLSDDERQTRIREIIGSSTWRTRISKSQTGFGLRQGYQPNSHSTVLNETCIKPLISFR